jgi:hypothetical protein
MKEEVKHRYIDLIYHPIDEKLLHEFNEKYNVEKLISSELSDPIPPYSRIMNKLDRIKHELESMLKKEIQSDEYEPLYDDKRELLLLTVSQIINKIDKTLNKVR